MNYRQNDREFVLRMSATKPPLVLFTQQGYVIAGLVDGYVKLRLGGAANGDDSDVGVLETLEV